MVLQPSFQSLQDNLKFTVFGFPTDLISQILDIMLGNHLDLTEKMLSSQSFLLVILILSLKLTY